MAEPEDPWVKYAALSAQQSAASPDPSTQEDGPWVKYRTGASYMPRFQIQTPQGSFEVEAPDQSTAISALGSHLGGQTSQQGTTPVVPPVSAAPSQDPTNPASPQPSMSAADVLTNAAKNFLPSAMQLGQDMVQPIMHPIDTANALGSVAGGVAAKMGIGNADQSAANAMGQFFANRYGGVENIKQTMANDPVGFLSDLATVLSGGAMAGERAPGVLGTVSRAAGAVGSAVDPMANVGRVVGKVGQGVGTAVSAGLGLTTGVGGDAIRAMQRAGFGGNTAALAQMRDAAPVTDILDRAKSALGELDKDRMAQYQTDMAPARADPTVLNFNGIDQALADANDMVRFKGVVKNPDAANALDKMQTVVNDWKQLDPAEYHTPIGFDALKQLLNNTVYENTQPGTLSQKIAKDVYNKVKDNIEAQVPAYAPAMRAYADAADNSNQIRQTLSLGQNATDDTSIRKLLSTTRNNVNTNFGTRQNLVDQLAQKEPALPGMLAGRAMSALEPQGIARVLHSSAGYAVPGAALLSNPPALGTALATLAMSSPRIVGETAYGIGAARRALNPGQILNPAQMRLIRQSAFQAGRAAQMLGGAQ
jgi:hypothetical protein